MFADCTTDDVRAVLLANRFLFLVFAFITVSISTVAQDTLALKRLGKSDTLRQFKSVDSLPRNTDSLQRKFTAPLNKVQSAINRLNHKEDSLAPHNLSVPSMANPGDYLKKSRADSMYQYKYKSVDSLQRNFHHRIDSLQKAYTAPLNKIHLSINKLNHKKDSLTRLNLPIQAVTHQLDSLQKSQTAKLSELNGKIDKVKGETLTKVSALHLPPEAQNEINALTKNIHSFKAPNNFLQVPEMNFIPKNFQIPGFSTPNLKLPSNLNIPSENIPSLKNLNLNVNQMPSLAQMEGSLGKDLKQLPSATDMKSMEQTATKELSQNTEVKSFMSEQTQVKDMTGQFSKMNDAKEAGALAQKQLRPTIDHFAGKEKELQSAMGTMSKYKEKYNELKNAADTLNRRARNPFRGKPWIERVVPGLNYFIFSRNSTFVDFNPYLGWRFTTKITASLGWSERIGVSHGHVGTKPFDRVHGVRGSVSYDWTHGIVFRVSPELMSAYVPVNTTNDIKEQALIFGLFAGVRKDFKIYKGVIGYTEGMYNFTQKSGQNIYGDRLSLRLGIEVKIRKRVKK